jgi:Coenzyme PQQ synthesis protein D (PqqD)
VWELCDGATTVLGIAGKIAEEFEVDEETAVRDTLEFVAVLSQRKLIEI